MACLLGLFSEDYSLGTTLLETRILKFSMKYLPSRVPCAASNLTFLLMLLVRVISVLMVTVVKMRIPVMDIVGRTLVMRVGS